MVYNLANISNHTTGIATLAQGINNELMFGWLGVLLLLIIASIAFMTFQAGSGNASKSFSATSFILTGFAILLRLLSLISDLALFITIILSAGTLALSLASGK